MLPLSFILFITLLKDVYEDYQRHKADAEENNLKYLVYNDKLSHFEKTNSSNIRVGNIVKVSFFLCFDF